MEALLIVDMCNDFVTGKLKCDRAQRIIPGIARMAEAARKADVPVIYCGDAHLPTDFELRVWGPHAMKGTWGAEVIPELKPQPRDIVLEKRTYSAFFETGLDEILRAHGVKELVITGLHTNICDRHTTADAFFRGYVPIIPEDGVEAMDEESHRLGLDYLRTIYGAAILSSDEVVKAWKGRR